MPHEKKQCPRCGTDFECRVGDIINCQCSGIQLSGEAAQWVQERYLDECLCRNCLQQLQQRHSLFIENAPRYRQR